METGVGMFLATNAAAGGAKKIGELFLGAGIKKCKDIKTKQEWKKLFIDTGEFCIKNIDDAKLCQERGVKVTVVTWDAEVYGYGDSTHRIEMIMQLREAGIIVETVEEACQHYAVIYNKIVWYGSMNLLAKEDVDDNIMRIESEDIAAEILDITFGNS